MRCPCLTHAWPSVVAPAAASFRIQRFWHPGPQMASWGLEPEEEGGVGVERARDDYWGGDSCLLDDDDGGGNY